MTDEFWIEWETPLQRQTGGIGHETKGTFFCMNLEKVKRGKQKECQKCIVVLKSVMHSSLNIHRLIYDIFLKRGVMHCSLKMHRLIYHIFFCWKKV